MAKFYKVLVTGTFNAGKTTFVETLSDIDPVNTDKATTNPIEQAVKELWNSLSLWWNKV